VRVALLTYNARPGDAIGNHVAEKLRFFRERGAEVRVFVESDRGLHPDVAGDTCLWTNPEPGGEHWNYLSACDVVVAEFGQHYPLLDLLPLLAGRKPRILIDYHGVTPPELWGRHNREALVRGIRQRGLVCCADVVLVHSRYTYNELRRECNLPPERLYQIGYVVPANAAHVAWASSPLSPVCGGEGLGGSGSGLTPDADPLTPSPSPPEYRGRGEKTNYRKNVQKRLRQQLRLEHATVLLYVGRLAANKRVPLLVEAVHHLRDVRPGVYLLIAGDDRDIYAAEAEHCRALAQALGVADRIHFLGQCGGEKLEEAYRVADLFVTASAWESFCIPLVEAMAHGVPVVAARATATPDTLANAGLTFVAEDAADLARVARRVLDSHAPLAAKHNASALDNRKNIAVVCLRDETGIISGVERSLRTIADALRRAGHRVEWLTAERDTPTQCGDRSELSALPHSQQLFDKLGQHADSLDAIITGPYLSGLTFEIARRHPEKTLLLPCFHDEPSARKQVWHEAYQQVAGFLYHSAEEQTLAQSELGFNHPNAVVIGTLLEEQAVNGDTSPPAVKGRYVVYCGRYTAEKNLPLLLEYASRYRAAHPERFQFAFMGTGNVLIPDAPGFCNLGQVPDTVKEQVLTQADALVTLSCRESLSLAALEAWRAGTPVVAHANCAVLAANIERSGGGAAVTDYATFAAALNDLWDNPEVWRDKGTRGQMFVRGNYQGTDLFVARLEQALKAMSKPLYQQLQEKGFARAAEFSPAAWHGHFAAAVEQALHRERDASPLRLEVRRRLASRCVAVGCERVLVPVRVINWGEYSAAADGPGRVVIWAQVREDRSGKWVGAAQATPLPRLVVPRDKVSAAVSVPVPRRRGRYEVVFWAQAFADESSPPNNADRYTSSMRLRVGDKSSAAPEACSLLLGTMQQELEEADRLQSLPEDYLDVTQGALARLKRRIKQTLLHNFKVSYVDVLSRQQSAFNRQILSVVQELAECCALLDHAVQQLQQQRPRRRQKRKRPQN
jgi:glycosyltransferase involved in cell wall biosynthesis